MRHIKLYEDWKFYMNESLIGQTDTPGELKVISPSASGKYQYFHIEIKNPTMPFGSFKKDFMAHPQKYLSNDKSTFHQPTDGKGNKLPGLKEGAFIEIEIAGVMSVYVKATKAYISDSGTLHATFVTLDGHVEKGYINFAASMTGDEFKFAISSYSETNSLAPEGFAREEQKESWFSMLKKLPKLIGGSASAPIFSQTPPKQGKTFADIRKASETGEILIAQNKTKKPSNRA